MTAVEGSALVVAAASMVDRPDASLDSHRTWRTTTT